MPRCPSGHSSTSADYCDVCGELMAGTAPAPPPTGGETPTGGEPAAGGETTAGPASEVRSPSATVLDLGSGDEPCPVDGTPRTGRFCETCGYDFATGSPGDGPATVPSTADSAGRPDPPGPAGTRERPGRAPGASTPGGWSVVVSADRAHFEAVLAALGSDAGSLAFPPYAPDRHLTLTVPQVRIGRRSVSRGFIPEIDLGISPADPGVSHLHAVLLARPDGTWVLVDPGSTNGTTLNGSTDPIGVNVEVPVHDGDRIHVGAWTTITLRKE